ncbi:MAG: RIP metalloprotease RseP [Pseudomonadota bacterium]
MDVPVASPSIAFNILMFLVVITPLVFVHEMGHFLVGRLFKVKIDAFSIGFGREIFGWTDKHGTRWKISPIPFGGYVKFAGDANAASRPSETLATLTAAERRSYFHFKPLYQRALIVAAGPLVNFAFAIVIYAGLFMTLGQPYSDPIITSVVEPSPAFTAGFEPGDRVTALNGRRIKTFEEVVNFVLVRPNTPMTVTVERAGEALVLDVVPKMVRETDRFGNVYEKGQIGVAAARSATVKRGPVEAVFYGTIAVGDKLTGMLDGLWQIISGRISVDQLSGPVRIAKLSGEMASISALGLVEFMAFISISLGLVNLFPIPMLDGGHLLFYAYEGLRRRPASMKLQERAMYAGFLTVIGWSVFVTWNDLKVLKVWETLSKLVS